ncbi:protein of unknown function [Magnetospirillum sp. XM-1]|uniref:hypothetical protein n=1 Tax=Magnetospirillum sp. XM-1 TaxID=1663591 RepID=UPI00073DF59F|nr:hypothetical protein [Magnetospirillum sp. XM-1]CUW41086.1 protein of unknown function [Magnetospirillum sp. XM-1]
MLDENLKQQLRGYLGHLRHPVTLAASLDDSDKSQEMMALLEDIASLSDIVSVTSRPDPRTPSFAIERSGTDVAVRFAGLPMGHEFNSLVLALLQVGGQRPLPPQQKRRPDDGRADHQQGDLLVVHGRLIAMTISSISNAVPEVRPMARRAAQWTSCAGSTERCRY